MMRTFLKWASAGLVAVVCGGVAWGQPVVTTTSLPDGDVNQNLQYSQTLSASDNTPLATCCTWAVTSGALPGGLTLDPSGVISGTPNTSGTANFQVTATNNLLLSPSPQSLSINVHPQLQVTTSSLPGGQVGLTYRQTTLP